MTKAIITLPWRHPSLEDKFDTVAGELEEQFAVLALRRIPVQHQPPHTSIKKLTPVTFLLNDK